MDNTVLALLFFLAALTVFFFNRFVVYRNRSLAAWSDVNVQLIRRHNLLPNLVRTAKGHAKFEQQTLSLVTLARSYKNNINVDRANEIETKLNQGLASLNVLIEHYPGLRASESYQELSKELVATEDAIQHARRYYNGATKAYNTALQQFPGVLFAMLFRFEKTTFFELDSATVKSPVLVKKQ